MRDFRPGGRRPGLWSSRVRRSRVRRSRVRRSAVAMLAAVATVAGLLMAGGPAGAQGGAPRQSGGTGLPSPGPLLAAPSSLSAAKSEISRVLAQAENPKTALLGTVRLLVNSGATIVNGPATVYAGRRGGPPLFIEAGQVQALARDIAGPRTGLAGLLKGYAGADISKLKKYATAAFYGKNFASEIAHASDAAEYLWGAVLLDADTSAKGLLASLRGGGTPADALAPLQLEFLSLRLESDTLGLAASLYPRPRAAHDAAAARPQSAAASVTCDITDVPESFFEGVSGAYSTGISVTLKAAGLAAKAEKYDATMQIAAGVLSILNLALMMATLTVKTTISPDPLVRTQSTASDGERSKLTSEFSFATSNTKWAGCIRAILDLASLDVSAPGPVKDMHVAWSVADGDPAFVDPDTMETGKTGVASTWLEGKRQPAELIAPVPYSRPITITESVNPLLSRSLADLVAHYSVITIQAALGGLAGWTVAAVQVAADSAQALGLIRTQSTVGMTDWKDGNALPTAFSMSVTLNDSTGGSAPITLVSDGPITSPEIALPDVDGESDYFSATPPLTGTVTMAQNTQYSNCNATAAIDDSSSDIALTLYPPNPVGDSFSLGIGETDNWFGVCGAPDAWNVSGAQIWKPGETTTTVPLIDAGADSAVGGSVTFDWIYGGK